MGNTYSEVKKGGNLNIHVLPIGCRGGRISFEENSLS